MQYTPAPLSPDESRRLAALHDLQVLDSAAESEFDALVQAAALVCNVPVSLISLVDEHRQWFKANVGLPGVSETPRDQAFCAHAVLDDALMEVPDARDDPRFAHNPLVVGEPNIRFYAGSPLRLSDGARVGTLCVIDRQPRALDARQRAVLDHLALAAARALEHRRAVRLQQQLLQTLSEQERALSAERARLQNILHGTAAGTWEWNLVTGEVRHDERWAGMIGWRLADLLPMHPESWNRHVHPADLLRARDLLNQHVQGHTPHYECELRMWHREGRWIWVLARARVISRTPDGQPEWVAGTHQDITDSRRLATELAEQHELMRVTLQSIGDAVITTDASGHVVWLNPVAERLTGWSSRDARARPLRQVFHIVDERTREPAADPVAACLAGGEVVALGSHTLLISRDGTEYGVEDSAAPIRSEQGTVLGTVLVFHDVTEQRRLSGEMNWRASHDPLTGLVNRTEFESRLARVLKAAQEERSHHALLFIDLDQFKLVNDTCGHAAGDQLLQQVARMLGDQVRTRDTLARLGGDEFAVILEHCRLPQARRVAQQICDRLEQYRFIHDSQRFRIGASIGLVPVDERWRSTAAVLQAADSCCHAAKEAGRNRVQAWRDDDGEVSERHGAMRWAMRLERALDEHQFVLFAQRIEGLSPRLPGATQPAVHAEVLLRLREPDGSLVAPGAFLPAAERFHLASRIDRWVLRQVLDWMAATPHIADIECLSVNLSGQTIGDRSVHGQVMGMLREAGPQVCSRLCLEITETAAITRLADAALFIEQVRAAGVRVALDDFGAGVSSFGYLKSLRVDKLKIDGQFIRQLEDDALEAAAVRCFVDVARVAGLETVAEFVETEGQRQRLCQLGVNYAQGYLLHEPAPLHTLFEPDALAADAG
ncbi:EAL domain-containing protein [Ideonella sp. DXS22W]|uniref:EAL domain-containing protein n=1 Tax=Pseudaquabacterium inlustre TaxID=2984192 RepID=A0ABU9CJ58_9BURK